MRVLELKIIVNAYKELVFMLGFVVLEQWMYMYLE